MREVFEPARYDLRIAHLERVALARSRAAIAVSHLRYAIAVVVLALDCLRLYPSFRAQSDTPPTGRSPHHADLSLVTRCACSFASEVHCRHRRDVRWASRQHGRLRGGRGGLLRRCHMRTPTAGHLKIATATDQERIIALVDYVDLAGSRLHLNRSAVRRRLTTG